MNHPAKIATGDPAILYLANVRSDAAGSFEVQFRSVFSQISGALQKSGLEWTDLVCAWIRLADMQRDFPTYNQLWREQFSSFTADRHSCRTTVSVSNLPREILMEMDIIARKKDASFTLRNSHRAPDPVGLYSHAIQFGDTLYVAGIGPRKKGSKDIPGVSMGNDGKVDSYDIDLQNRSVFDNIGYILEDAGFAWKDLQSGRFYLTDMNDLPALKATWADYFKAMEPHDRPAFDALKLFEVSALPTPINAEMDCVLVRKGSKP